MLKNVTLLADLLHLRDGHFLLIDKELHSFKKMLHVT